MAPSTYRSHCGRNFQYLKHCHQHYAGCSTCQQIITVQEHSYFSDSSAEESEHTDNEDPSTGLVREGLLFLDHPQQTNILAALFLKTDVHDYISGMCYFEPDHPPPYYIRGSEIRPPFVPCTLKMSHRQMRVGYVRESSDTIVDTWLLVKDNMETDVDNRTRTDVRTEFEDTWVLCDGVRETLMPRQAMALVSSVFRLRIQKVARELERLNTARLRAYNVVKEQLRLSTA